MRRAKKLYVLLGVLLVVSAATFILSGYQAHREKISSTGENILEIPSDTVTALSWENDSGKLAFHKDGTWRYDADGAFPVSQEKIDQMLEQFRDFRAAFVIENVEDYGQYGLEKPVCTIQISQGDKTCDVKLGDFSKMDSQRYVSIGDGNVYLMVHDPLEEFDAVLSDMIENDQLPAFDTVNELRFAGAADYSAVREENSGRSACADDLYFTQAGPLDTDRVNAYLNNITNLALKDYVSYNASDAQLHQYGLDTPELTLAVDYTYQNEDKKEVSDTFTLRVGRNPEDVKAAEKKDASGADADAEGDKIPAYVRVGESKILYQISGEQYDKLMAATYNDLRHQEILSADFDTIQQVNIALDGMDYVLTHKAGAQSQDSAAENGTWYYQGTELDASDFPDALRALKADGFTDEEPSQKEEIQLTVHLNNKNVPTVKMDFYRYDGSHCLAVVDGRPVALVQRSLVVDLVEAVHKIVLTLPADTKE